MRDIILAGGCFWCIEADFKKLNGVVKAESGYTGDTEESANYEAVCSGLTDHIEAVKVTFDESIITYKEIIEYFWTCIDPTNPYGQFADVGSQYVTVIYYKNENEKMIIERSKEKLDLSGRFEKPIMTKILKEESFFSAEPYHQDYYLKNKTHYEQYRKYSGRTGFIQIKWGDKRG